MSRWQYVARRVRGGCRFWATFAWVPILGFVALTVVACANSPSSTPGAAPTCHSTAPATSGPDPVTQTGCSSPITGSYYIPRDVHVDCSELPSPTPATSGPFAEPVIPVATCPTYGR